MWFILNGCNFFVSIGLGNDMAQNRKQAIAWQMDGLIQKIRNFIANALVLISFASSLWNDDIKINNALLHH